VPASAKIVEDEEVPKKVAKTETPEEQTGNFGGKTSTQD
jgi:hypothetical protein